MSNQGKNLSLLEKLASNLIKGKQMNYSEEYLSLCLENGQYQMDQLLGCTNSYGNRLKCTLIQHIRSPKKSNTQSKNKKCIVFLHGLGSTRLQALSLLPYLPFDYCLCTFDMSGSGKSTGQFITYGLRQKEDIEPVLQAVYNKLFIQQFIIWGRSMGAVATLLYAIDYNKKKQNNKIDQSSMGDYVKCLVLDSPFHNFKDIAKEIALHKTSVPLLFLDIGLHFIHQAFNTILYDKQSGVIFDPFKIDFSQQIHINSPCIIVYSQNDQIVAPQHSQKIIKNFKSRFQKIVMKKCSHNAIRPAQVIKQIFIIANKMQKSAKHHKKKQQLASINESFSMCRKTQKRGINVYTPSKQKYDGKNQHRLTLDINNKYLLMNANLKRQSLYSTFNSRRQLQIDIIEDKKYEFKLKKKSIGNFNNDTTHQLKTIESDKMLIKPNINNEITDETMHHNYEIANKIIKNRLENTFKRPNRMNNQSRRIYQHRRQIKLTHHKYLQ